MEKKYYSVDEACEFLGIKKTKLYELMKGGLPYIKLGKLTKFDKVDLISYMDSLKQVEK